MKSPEDLRAEVDAIRWYHVLDLGQGFRTPGVYDPSSKLSRYALPDLHGKTVLDVGAWDGFFSFEAERRGAARVLATDSFSWDGSNWSTKAGFQLARRALGSRVEDETIDVLDLAPERIGTFDVVLFLGVLYHMRHPMLALERVASVTEELLILETLTDLMHLRRPALAFYAGREQSDDPTNWFGPNPAAVVEMLYACGFSRVEVRSPTTRALVLAKYAYIRLRRRGYRMVFHAWK